MQLVTWPQCQELLVTFKPKLISKWKPCSKHFDLRLVITFVLLLIWYQCHLMLVLSLLFEPNVGSDVAETCCFFVIVDGCLENLKLIYSTCLSKFKILLELIGIFMQHFQIYYCWYSLINMQRQFLSCPAVWPAGFNTICLQNSS